MSNDLRASRGIEVAKRLTSSVAAFAKREEQLTRALRSRSFGANRQHQEAIEKTEASLAAELARTQTSLAEQEAAIKAKYERRRARVQRVSNERIRSLPMRAKAAKERWMGDLQMVHFRADRNRTESLTRAAGAFERSTAALAERRQELSRLERQARKLFGGYGSFLSLLSRARSDAGPAGESTADRDHLLAELEARLKEIEQNLERFRGMPFPRFFSVVALPVVILLAALVGAGLVFALGHGTVAIVIGVLFFAVLSGAAVFMHRSGMQQAAPVAQAIASAVTNARETLGACHAAAEARHEEDRRGIEEQHERTAAEVAGKWNRADDVEADFQNSGSAKLEKQVPRLSTKIEETMRSKLARIESERASRTTVLKQEEENRKRQLLDSSDSEKAVLTAGEKAEWQKLEEDWKREITPIYEMVTAMNSLAASEFPAWTGDFAEAWNPPTEFLPETEFGRLEVDITVSGDGELALPGPSRLSIPLALSYPDKGSLLFETNGSGEPEVIGALNNTILRLLSTTPPGKLSFTIIDPVGLGQNFAGLMHLGDYEEALINRRIWTQRDQIEERLAELNEHIEKIIQMYLRNEYATIVEYNRQAGSVAEKYNFLVVADFPANFSETAARRLQSLAASGPRCGLYTLIHWDRRLPLPDGFVADELRKNSVCIRREGNQFVLDAEASEAGARLVFDQPPDPELAVKLINRIGKSSIDSNRVEVPFVQIAPKPDELWTADTTSELKVAIGRTGATKLQYLAIGKGTRQHALFAGKTGSGKSTLFHVIITNLALSCSPEQVEFYLIDFKKGVEFKCYASKRLPHAKVVAIESDREFGLSVLQRVDDELKRRGDLFRKLGVQDIAGYKRAGGGEPIPRSLLIIDEFQEFFVDDDAVAQSASLLFDRIVRQGRAFGIHVLLGSQTLGGAYSLARATLGQMAIRVALQCNEADAYLIMDDNNSAPRLLSRPGEGIYNDAAGAVEGNSPFQVVWLPDAERDSWLDKVHELAERNGDRRPGPVVFEGNAPADLRENHLLESALTSEPAAPPAVARAWLGAPNSIKGPTEAAFRAQSGNNLLLVGQRDEAALTLLGVSLLALAAQYPRGKARFIFIHATSPGSQESDFIEQICEAAPHEVMDGRPQDVAGIVNELSTELKTRSAGEGQTGAAPSIFLFVHGLQKFKKLRSDDDIDFSFSSSAESGPKTGAQFTELICEGSSHGIHVITSLDTFNNVNRFLGRKALSEFEMRVVFQMSANDSASLIDSPKASGLGLHRALFYNEHEGHLETFRPYAMPDAEWIREAAQKLVRQNA